MKKLTKILLLVMLAALAVSAFAFSAFAEEVDNTVYTYGGFTVNGTAYPPSNESGTTLADVVNSATEETVITLNNNILVSENLAPKANLTLNLNGKTVDSTAKSLFDYATSATKGLTIKVEGTGTVNCSYQFLYNGGSWKFYVTSSSSTDRILINAKSTEQDTGNTFYSISGTVTLTNVDVVSSAAFTSSNNSVFYNNKTKFTLDGCNVTSDNSTTVTDTSYIFKTATTGGTESTPHLYTFKNSTLDAAGTASRGFNVGNTASVEIIGSKVNMPMAIRMESGAILASIKSSTFTSTENTPLYLGGSNITIDSAEVTASTGNGNGALYLSDTAAASNVTVTNSTFENKTKGYAVRIESGTETAAVHSFTDCKFITNSSTRYGTVYNASSSTLTLTHCSVSSVDSHGIYLAGDATKATLENCEISTAAGSAVYLSSTANAALDNCYISTQDAFNLQSEGTLSVKETYVNATGHAFYIIDTAGITVDACIVHSAAKDSGSGSTFIFNSGAASNIMLDNDAYIINATNSTFSSEGASGAQFIYVADAISTGTISGTISFDGCTVSTRYRCVATNLDGTHLSADSKLTFQFNDTAIYSVQNGSAQHFFRGYGTLINFTGNSKVVHSKTSPQLSIDAQIPVEDTMNFAAGTRLSFIPGDVDVGFTLPDGYSLVYDPFGDSEAPYVVADTEAVNGFILSDNVFNTALGNSFGYYDTENAKYVSEVGMQIGFQHSLGSSMLSNCEENGNTFVKYTLPTESSDNVTVNTDEGTVKFTGSTDFFVIGSGSVEKSAVDSFTVTRSDDTTYAATTKAVIVMQMNFTAGSDTGYAPFSLQLASRGGSITSETSSTAGSSYSGSVNLISISSDYTFEACDGNTYSLNGYHSWHNLYVVVDVANNKLHAYVNGSCISGDGITAMGDAAQYIQGFRINLKKNTTAELTDSIAFDGFAAATYDNYVSDSFVLDDYLDISDVYKTLAPTTENIIAKGHAFGTLDSALAAVKGTDYTVRLLGDVNEAQTVGTSGTVITLDNKLNLANDNTEKFIKYTKATTGAFGDVYTFAYNKSLGTTVNLSLYSSFDINLFIPEALVPYVEKIAVGETDITADAYEFDGKLVASVGRAADEANDSVIFKVTFVENGKSYTYSFTISIVAYTEKLLADYSDTNKTTDHILMYYILNYANEANIYFDGNEALAERASELSALADSTIEDATASSVNTLDTELFYGATVVLDETPSLRLVLNAKTDKTITASYIDVKTGTTRYADVTVDGVNVDLDGIKIYNLAETLTIYADGESVGTFNIGAYTNDVEETDEHYDLVNAFCEYISLAKYLYKAQ